MMGGLCAVAHAFLHSSNSIVICVCMCACVVCVCVFVCVYVCVSVHRDGSRKGVWCAGGGVRGGRGSVDLCPPI